MFCVLLAGSNKNKAEIFYLEEQEKEMPVIYNKKDKPVTNKVIPFYKKRRTIQMQLSKGIQKLVGKKSSVTRLLRIWYV